VCDRIYSWREVAELILLSFSQTFICQSEKDYKTLNQLNDDRRHVCRYNGREQKVTINTITITERDLEEPRDMLPPAEVSVRLLSGRLSMTDVALASAQLERLGIDCYAIQLCEAPPHVLAFLRTQSILHRAVSASVQLPLMASYASSRSYRLAAWTRSTVIGWRRPGSLLMANGSLMIRSREEASRVSIFRPTDLEQSSPRRELFMLLECLVPLVS
jgi:hypothetical protein